MSKRDAKQNRLSEFNFLKYSAVFFDILALGLFLIILIISTHDLQAQLILNSTIFNIQLVQFFVITGLLSLLGTGLFFRNTLKDIAELFD